jgi:hypothetical protein
LPVKFANFLDSRSRRRGSRSRPHSFRPRFSGPEARRVQNSCGADFLSFYGCRRQQLRITVAARPAKASATPCRRKSFGINSLLESGFRSPMFEAIHSYERRPRFLRRFSRLATCFFFYNLLSLSADVEVHAAASAPRHASRRSIRSNETPKAAQILGLWGCRGPIRFASTSDLADGSAVALATAERTRESSLEQGLGPQDVVSIGASSRGNSRAAIGG